MINYIEIVLTLKMYGTQNASGLTRICFTVVSISCSKMSDNKMINKAL